MPNEESDRRLKALDHFKDWSNYLLVTTVASLGWASTREAQLPDLAFGVCVFLLAASVVFGIFTLAMIPLVTEQLDQEESFYDVKPRFRPVPGLSEVTRMTIKWVCWPQHVLFILGIAVYAFGSVINLGEMDTSQKDALAYNVRLHAF